MRPSPAHPQNIYQTPQIREFERLAQEKYNVSSHVLMQRAGKAAFDFLVQRWPQAEKITVFCGSGNNGGDGYVLAAYAAAYGMKVVIWQVGNHQHLTSEANAARAACQQQATITIQAFNADLALSSADVTADLVVDAICGIGIRGPLKGDPLAAIETIRRAQAPILAIDVPSGIEADTGQVLGTAVAATSTITFMGLKLGLLTGSGIAHTGELVCNDLQLPAELFSHLTPIAERIALPMYASYLQSRPRDWHKGLSGHVLIVGGDHGYSGAPRMAAEAALRVGAGLVTVATRHENAVAMNVTRPEIMCTGVDSAQELTPLMEKADVIVLGPGLGQSDWAKNLFEHTYQSSSLPLIVDADGLNLLANTTQFNKNWVLTPHPGEAARLLGLPVHAIQADRLAAVQAIQQRYGGACVLKGAGSLIASARDLPALCDQGNSGMASAGMGDVLSGVIGGVLAQGAPLHEATKLSVCLHAMAGDLAAQAGERGMIATDLMPFLRLLSNLPLP